MIVHVYAHCRNEAALANFWARHYSAFADRITVFDDSSDDGTLEVLAKYPKVTVIPIAHNGLNEHAVLALAHEKVAKARDKCDWVMWPDLDEFIHHPDMVAALKRYHQSGYDVIRPLGFNMMGGLPSNVPGQLPDILRTGVMAPVYSKPIVVNPAAVIEWGLGKHTITRPGTRINPWGDVYQPDPWRLRLLHYRFLNPEYCAARNARQYARSTSKEAAWTCTDTYTGEHSSQWVARTMRYAYDVVSGPACYKAVPGVWPRLPRDA